jgi:hypothetical protein
LATRNPSWLRSVSEKKARKWMWIGLAAIVAVQAYFVQELLAALLLFSAIFAVLAAVGLVLFLLDRASQRTLSWAESLAEPPAKHALALAHRAWVAADLSSVSKKLHHRPHSETAR